MKSRSIFPAAILALASAGSAAGAGGILFSNKDHLDGSPTSIGKDRIVWNSQVLEKPAAFLLDSVREIQLRANEPASDKEHQTAVRLTNGDLLRGHLSAVSDTAVQLDTWYAGNVTLSRAMVESVTIEDRPKLIFRGPESIDGWSFPSSARVKPWIFESDSLLSVGSGSIARDVGLTDQCRIAFTMEWESSAQLTLGFNADKVTSMPTSSYELRISHQNANFGKRGGGGFGNQFQMRNWVGIPALKNQEKVRVEMRMDRKKGVFNLLVDGRPTALWEDPNAKEMPAGTGIHFTSNDGNPIRVSGIEVTAWDGAVETPPPDQDPFMEDGEPARAPDPKEAEERKGRMLLRNGDTLAGEILGVENGIIRFKAAFGEIKLPVSRFKTVELKPAEREVPKIRRGDIRAWFPDGSRVVFRLDDASLETLTGYSQNFGTATFKTAAFSRIEFNLYDPKLQEQRGEKDW